MRKDLLPVCITNVLLIIFFCNACTSKSGGDTSYLESTNNYYDSTAYNQPPTSSEQRYITIPYKEMLGNTITIPVKVNGMILDMIFDTGASSTMLSIAEARYMLDKGLLNKEDFTNIQQFQIANGDIMAGFRVNLRSVILGDKITLHDIEAVIIENQQAPLLLGQSVMKQFREISVDRENKVVKFFE